MIVFRFIEWLWNKFSRARYRVVVSYIHRGYVYHTFVQPFSDRERAYAFAEGCNGMAVTGGEDFFYWVFDTTTEESIEAAWATRLKILDFKEGPHVR
jgi:hypothetical protein